MPKAPGRRDLMAKRIRRLKRALRATDADLATVLGACQSSVFEWRHGNNIPLLSMQRKIERLERTHGLRK